ncbi:MAG TPA: AraC family transcriptional regulator [Trebonia sp.]|jgi:AraC-like DNA-binding protein|nr:AraC family transcriptional regulator [Trebonia sp.]
MTSWVPAGAWLAPGYAEWAAPARLRDTVSCLWASVVPDDADERASVVLPDGCCDLIWEQGVGAYVAGPDTAAVPVVSRPGSVSVGARFRPGHGGPALALPLSELTDQRVGLADVLPAFAGDTGLAGDRAPADAAALVLDLAGRLVADQEPDQAIARAARLLRDPAARTEDVAGDAGLSERQFRRRFHAAAGYGPKTLQRVLRFQRFVRQVDAAADVIDLAAAAVAAGYADQAHLTRECKALSGLTPTALARTRG